jgi:hypothetical protein
MAMRTLVLITAVALSLGACSDRTLNTASQAHPITVQASPALLQSRGISLGSSESDVVGVLGDAVASFSSVLPAEGTALRIDHFDRCAAGNLDQLIVIFDRGKAAMITRQSCGAPPAVQARENEAHRFFPTDASRAGTLFTTAFGQPAFRFVSRNLGQVIGRSWFRNCQGHSVPRGTFSLVVVADGWQLVAGTCP